MSKMWAVAGIAVAAVGCRSEETVKCGTGTILDHGTCVIAPTRDSGVTPFDARALAPDASAADGAAVNQWVYNDDVIDKMRDIRAHIATIGSEPVPNEKRGVLVVRQKTGDKSPEIIVGLNDLISCDDEMCFCHAKIDEGKVEAALAQPGTNHSAVFLMGAAKWLEQIKNAKQMIVECPLLGGGPRQVVFHVAELKWDTPVPSPPISTPH